MKYLINKELNGDMVYISHYHTAYGKAKFVTLSKGKACLWPSYESIEIYGVFT